MLEGRFGEASRQWESTARASPLNAPSALALAGRARLWDGDIAGARAALEAGDATSVHGPFVEARRTALAAGIAALEGRPGEAIVLYGRARDAMRDAHVMFELALVGLDMAVLLDPAAPAVEAAIEESRQILGRLGAGPLLARLEAAADGSLRPTARLESRAGPLRRNGGPPRPAARRSQTRRAPSVGRGCRRGTGTPIAILGSGGLGRHGFARCVTGSVFRFLPTRRFEQTLVSWAARSLPWAYRPNSC